MRKKGEKRETEKINKIKYNNKYDKKMKNFK